MLNHSYSQDCASKNILKFVGVQKVLNQFACPDCDDSMERELWLLIDGSMLPQPFIVGEYVDCCGNNPSLKLSN